MTLGDKKDGPMVSMLAWAVEDLSPSPALPQVSCVILGKSVPQFSIGKMGLIVFPYLIEVLGE